MKTLIAKALALLVAVGGVGFAQWARGQYEGPIGGWHRHRVPCPTLA